MHAASMRKMWGKASSGVSNRRALLICGTKQQSANVGVLPWQKVPGSGLLASTVSRAVRAAARHRAPSAPG